MATLIALAVVGVHLVIVVSATKRWVRVAAEAYAKQLLSACDSTLARECKHVALVDERDEVPLPSRGLSESKQRGLPHLPPGRQCGYVAHFSRMVKSSERAGAETTSIGTNQGSNEMLLP